MIKIKQIDLPTGKLTAAFFDPQVDINEVAKAANPEKVTLIGDAAWHTQSAAALIPEIIFGTQFPQAIIWKSQLSIAANHQEQLNECFKIFAEFSLKNEINSIPTGAYAAEIDADTRAAALEAVTEIFAIEDIFPDHGWEAHREESLAACFHTLAAYFIQLGSFGAAQDCLDQSDSLEDSPRAFALRAMISKAKGETLGAVANMVSSLQQYEQRKKETAEHYITFSPLNIEVINEKLKDGLDALNRRENEEALDSFTEAVFNFDGFYHDVKLSS